MKKKLFGSLLLATAIIISGISFNAYRSNVFNAINSDSIRPYNKMLDETEVQRIFQDNFYHLTADTSFNFNSSFNEKNPSLYRPHLNGMMRSFVLYDNSNLAGFMSCYMENKYSGKLLYLGVDKAFRKKGYGKQLAQHSCNYLKSQGAKVIHVCTRTTNKKAQNLYISLGFKFINEERGFIFYRKET